MNKGFRVICGTLVFLCCFGGFGQKQKYYKVKDQEKDFRTLKTTILENTGKPYLYTDSLAFVKLSDSIELQLRIPRTDLELFQLFSTFVSAVKCAHTSISFSKRVIKNYAFYPSTFPGSVQLINHELYAASAIGKVPKITKGDKIISINGMSMENILIRMRERLSSDGNNITMKDGVFKDFFSLYYYLTFGVPESFRMEFINEKEDTLTTELKPEEPDLVKLRKKIKTSPLTRSYTKRDLGKLKIVKGDNYALLKFETFRYARGKKYREFIDSSFTKIRKSKTGYLVIDLRNNPGGHVQKQIAGYLSDSLLYLGYQQCFNNKKPTYKRCFKQKIGLDYLRYSYAVSRVKKSGSERFYRINIHAGKIPATRKYCGKIIVLVNGLSNSASVNLAANLKTKCKAVIIGEETGGSIRGGNTGQLVLKLPKTKFRVNINPVYYNNGISESLSEGNLKPDVEVTERFSLTRTEDPYMIKVLEYILKDSGKKH